ncbi:MAG: hypothetical protein KIT61_07845 [Pyrinomonadaceae bacterium]|nr:hypothetical protein [Pyrinomonadaceae bacterium]
MELLRFCPLVLCACLFLSCSGNVDSSLVPQPKTDDSANVPVDPVRVDFTGVKVLTKTSQCGYVDGIVQFTNDAGKSWQKQEESESKCRKFEFLPRTRVANSETYRIWNEDLSYSEDDGRTWLSVEALRGIYIKDFHFLDQENGWVLGSKITSLGKDSPSVLFATGDGGSTWNDLDITKNSKTNASFFGVWMRTRDEGFVVGDSILRTTDSGKSWENVSNKLPSEAIYGVPHGIRFFTNDVGVITSNQGGRFLVTFDGGKTWESRTAPPDTSFRQIEYLDNKHAIAVDGAIFVTGDSGRSWHKINDSDNFTVFKTSRELGLGVFWGKDYLVLELNDVLQSAF